MPAAASKVPCNMNTCTECITLNFIDENVEVLHGLYLFLSYVAHTRSLCSACTCCLILCDSVEQSSVH